MSTHSWMPRTLALALIVASTTLARAAVEIVPIARENDPSPDGDGTYDWYATFREPCINDSGEVVFAANLKGNAGGSASDEILVRVHPGDAPVILAREGSANPDGTGSYGMLAAAPRCYTLNNGGRVAFACGLTGTPGGAADNQAIYSTEGPGTEIEHARRGDVAPYTGYTFNGLYPPTLNNQFPANVAFYASLGTSGLPGTVYIATAASLSLVSWLGQAAPDGNGSISKFFDSEPPALRPNNAQVALWAHLTGTAAGSQDDDGIFLARSGGLAQVARGASPCPAGGTYGEFTGPVFNIMGEAAFQTDRYPVPSAGEAVVVGAGAIVDDGVAMTGLSAPDHNGTFDSFYPPSLSAGNVAAFKASLTGTTRGGLDDSGIYRGDGTVLIQVAREGQAVPEGGGEFATFGNVVAINAQAQVLFYATLRNTPGGADDNEGLYLWDEIEGMTKLVRTSDVIPGCGPVLGIYALSARDYGGFRSLNDASEAVALLDVQQVGSYRDGIYLFRKTDPGAVSPSDRARDLHVYPNPFGREGVRIDFRRGAGEVRVVDALGRGVRNLGRLNGTAVWDGRDEAGRPVGMGVYWIRIVDPSGASARRVVRSTR